ncbi:hypothetical protein ACIQLJ_15635 [Microbacterium sp. NPDC091313]
MTVDAEVVPAGAGDDDAAPPPGRRPRRRAAAVGITLGVLAFLGAGAGGGVAVAQLATQARQAALDARAVTSDQESVVDTALAASADLAGRIQAQSDAYRAADELWRSAEASAAAFHAEDDVPTVSAPNPGGTSLPGGDGEARALLDSIGGTDVQIVYDGGPQNCGFAAADAAYAVALGGCYDSRFRESVFLAWDRGATRDDIWPIFVHEAMHWYQWDRLSAVFAAAQASGIDREAYRPQIEADASCRAVIEHGVARSAYASSSAPCDVPDWSDGWLVQQLAALGVPTAAPDPEGYQVEPVVRP